VLQHLAGFLKEHLDPHDKDEVQKVIEEYRLGWTPLIAPLTLLQHHLKALRLPVFLREHPKTAAQCAQDRAEPGDIEGKERLLILINAPADGDQANGHDLFSEDGAARLKDRALSLAETCGLEIEAGTDSLVTTTPVDFNDRFPGSGGALYGRTSHGMMASFARDGAKTALPGLYLAGGSVHPGPGLPMATMSGRFAASQLCADHGLR